MRGSVAVLLIAGGCSTSSPGTNPVDNAPVKEARILVGQDNQVRLTARLATDRFAPNSLVGIRFDVENISASLPSTKRILSYEIWNEDLPRTTTRKLRRFEIEKKVKANQASGASGSSR